MDNIANRFLDRLAKIGISVNLNSNIPWVYMTAVNGKPITDKFMAKHGFTAFWWPHDYRKKVKFSDRRRVFLKVREMLGE